MFGLLAVVFVSMDHVIPGIIMAAAGFFLLIQSGRKNTRSSLDPGEQEPKKREMEYLIRKEHLEESFAEANRIYRNCESQYREALEAGEEEQKWQQRARECEMAASGIKKAAEALMSDWSGRLEQAASDILSGITAGKYYGLRIGTRMELTVTDGERVLDSDRLSYGTREQIWISVRLAAAMFLSEEAMPLVFDDAFLSWDDDRLAAVLCWLADCGRQILLFAGTGREQRILEKNGLKYDKIMLDE